MQGYANANPGITDEHLNIIRQAVGVIHTLKAHGWISITENTIFNILAPGRSVTFIRMGSTYPINH